MYWSQHLFHLSEQALKFNRDCEGVFFYTSYFKGMILLWVNKEINELFKYKHYPGNILTICRVSMVVGRGKGCLCQSTPYQTCTSVKFQPSQAEKKFINLLKWFRYPRITDSPSKQDYYEISCENEERLEVPAINYV